jgi:hypothetical protein
LASEGWPASTQWLRTCAANRAVVQIIGVAQVLGLLARQVHDPDAGFIRDLTRPARPRQIVQPGVRPEVQRPVDRALHLRPVRPQLSCDRRDRRPLRVGEEYLRPLHVRRRHRVRHTHRLQPRPRLFIQYQLGLPAFERHASRLGPGNPKTVRRGYHTEGHVPCYLRIANLGEHFLNDISITPRRPSRTSDGRRRASR